VAVGTGVLIAGIGIIAAAGAIAHGEELGDAWDAGADAISGALAAVSGKITERRLRGQENNISTHFGKLSNPGQPVGDDPNNRDKWKRDIQKGIREMQKRVEKLTGKDRERWDERIRQIQEQLTKTK